MFVKEEHSENILQEVWKLCESQNFCDVVLLAGSDGTRIPAHRLILASASDYFKAMFTSSVCDSNESPAIIPEVDGEILRSLVAFCYGVPIDIRKDNVEKILAAANFLLLDDAVAACATFLAAQLDPSNCLGIALLADQHDCKNLLKQAQNYIFENFAKVYKCDEFLKLNAKQLGKLLSSDELNVKSEKYAFESLILWIQHDPTGREKHKDELLSLVRMPLLSPDFIVDNIEPIFTSAKCQELIREALRRHLLPIHRTNYINARSSLRNSDQLLMAITTSVSQKPIRYFCPNRKMWLNLGMTLENRFGCGYAIINDDLFIVGGIGTNAVQCLNLATMTYRRVSPMLQCRQRCVAAVVCGNLYVLGASSKNSPITGERWCPILNTWSSIAPLTKRRYDFGIGVLNDKLYVIGGYDGGKCLCSAECYDPVKDTWTAIAPMKIIRDGFQAIVAQGYLYAIGGFPDSSIERYDPSNNNWSTICSKSNLPKGTFSCTTYREKIIALFQSKAMEFDFGNNSWQICTDLQGLCEVRFLFSRSVTFPQI